MRDKPRHSLVIDRLAYWYYVPREWLKKIALMDDVYLLNNPFTFQSMEKHSAYCAMMRLGLKIPETVLVPYKNPLDNASYAYTAERYNQPFDLEALAAELGYPMYMKPFDGGGWRGVSRIDGPETLRRGIRRLRRDAHAPAGSPSRTTCSPARCRSAPRRWSCTSSRTSRCTTGMQSTTTS